MTDLTCKMCGKEDDVRYGGICWDCAKTIKPNTGLVIANHDLFAQPSRMGDSPRRIERPPCAGETHYHATRALLESLGMTYDDDATWFHNAMRVDGHVEYTIQTDSDFISKEIGVKVDYEKRYERWAKGRNEVIENFARIDNALKEIQQMTTPPASNLEDAQFVVTAMLHKMSQLEVELQKKYGMFLHDPNEPKRYHEFGYKGYRWWCDSDKADLGFLDLREQFLFTGAYQYQSHSMTK
jgi:hypothetical protein